MTRFDVEMNLEMIFEKEMNLRSLVYISLEACILVDLGRRKESPGVAKLLKNELGKYQ